MNIQTIIIIVAVIAIIAMLVLRFSGPSVTQIDRTVRRENDEPEGRDDA